ncbi:MAG: hypothetical protein II907_04985 [Firmicutes bacterium]|nr:hypothetical protein [Bacillota bacterium]
MNRFKGNAFEKQRHFRNSPGSAFSGSMPVIFAADLNLVIFPIVSSNRIDSSNHPVRVATKEAHAERSERRDSQELRSRMSGAMA